MNHSKQLANYLLACKAVSLSPQNPFTWASGLKSPIYCDNRITLAFPEVRSFITEGLVSIIQTKYPEVECIAGTATAGIPQAALVAQVLGLPMIYVRSSAKNHGKENKIEGKLEAGQKVVVIEDLISTGGSCIEACESIKALGAEVLGVAANFTYQLQKGIENFSQARIQCETISNYRDLIEVAQEQAYISAEEQAVLMPWQQNPTAWSEAHQ